MASVPRELEELAQVLLARRSAGLPRRANLLPGTRPLARSWDLQAQPVNGDSSEPAAPPDMLALLRRAPAAPAGPELVYARRRRLPPAPPPARAEPAAPLPAALLEQLRPEVGAAAEDVRLHTGAAAQVMAARLGAAAFAHGRDVFVGRGRFRPEEPEGRALLAHEAVHVRQAQQGQEPGTAEGEAMADAAQQRVLARESPGQGALLAVDRLVRNYSANGAELTDREIVRLDAISTKAVTFCERLLASSPISSSTTELSSLHVPVKLNLDGASDDQLAETWGRALAREIERHISAAGTSRS